MSNGHTDRTRQKEWLKRLGFDDFNGSQPIEIQLNESTLTTSLWLKPG